MPLGDNEIIMQTNIIVADDHPLFRSALTTSLQQVLDQPKFIEAEDLNSLQRAVESHSDVDLVLLDLHMPGSEGFSALVFLVAHFPDIPVVVVSAHDDVDIIRRAMNHGASGFLSKSSNAQDMANAVNTVMSGGIYLKDPLPPEQQKNEEEMKTAHGLSALTPQQFRVAVMVGQGLLNKQIAYELGVTEATIKAHMTEIFRKLGVPSRTKVALAIGHLGVTLSDSSEEFK